MGGAWTGRVRGAGGLVGFPAPRPSAPPSLSAPESACPGPGGCSSPLSGLSALTRTSELAGGGARRR